VGVLTDDNATRIGTIDQLAPLTAAVNRLRHVELSIQLHTEQLAMAKGKLKEARKELAEAYFKAMGSRPRRAKVAK
jgi:hypothetical protein